MTVKLCWAQALSEERFLDLNGRDGFILHLCERPGWKDCERRPLDPAMPLFIPVPVPVVAPDFLDWVAPGPTLPSLDAPAAGWDCAEAMAVALGVGISACGPKANYP